MAGGQCEAAGGNRLFGKNDPEAKKRTSSARLHYSVQNAAHLPYADKSFNAVVISNALHIISEPEKALLEIRRVLKQASAL